MTSCVIVGLLVTCSGVQSARPEDAIRTFMASVTPLPTVSAPILGGSYLPPPLQQPTWPRIPPQWTSVTTWVPRFGPPVTWFTLPSGQVQPASNAPFVNGHAGRRTR